MGGAWHPYKEEGNKIFQEPVLSIPSEFKFKFHILSQKLVETTLL